MDNLWERDNLDFEDNLSARELTIRHAVELATRSLENVKRALDGEHVSTTHYYAFSRCHRL